MNEKGQNNRPNEKPPARDWQASEPLSRKILPWAEAGFALILVLVGIAQVCVYLRQADILGKQTTILDTQTKMSAIAQRAFVVFSKLEAKTSIDPTTKQKVWAITPTWENSGHTPTKDLQIFFSWCPRTTLLPGNFTFPDLANSGNNSFLDLGPNQAKPGRIYSTQPDIMRFVKDHVLMIYFYGWASYRDGIDDVPRRTQFCSVITDFEGDPTDDKATPVIEECPHNCEDKECNRYPKAIPSDAKMCSPVAFVKEYFAPQPSAR